MTSARWAQIKDIFEAVLDREERDRPAFLSNRCRGDSDLENEINRLLIADRESSDLLKVPLSNLGNLLSSEESTRSLALPQILCGRFEVLAYLGEGGMGQVYEALDLELRQHIAIKAIKREIADNPGVLSRFKREVYATRKVTHPNVCRTFDLERHIFSDAAPGLPERGITFLTMELLRGETLAQRLRLSGPLPLDQVSLFALQTAKALLAAHDAGIIHCDLKPSNIILTTSEDNFRAVVTDFGVAKFMLPQYTSLPSGLVTRDGQIAGTPFYMAPEQFRHGHCSPASDLYSYGLILYEALTGEKPSPTDCSPVEIQKRLNEVGDHSKGLGFEIDPKWSVVVSGCLQADLKNRFAHAQQVIDLIMSVPVSPSLDLPDNKGGTSRVDGLSIPWRQVTVSRFATPWAKLGLWYAAVILVVFFIVASVRYVLSNRRSQNPIAVPSVAVLPVVNVNGNPDLNYLSDGITATLTNDLSEVSGLRVPSQTVVRNLGKPLDLQSAGRRLDVDSIVAASVSKETDRLLLQIELVNAHTGVQLWGETYDRKEGDLAALQKDIAQEIAFRLRLKAESAPNQRIERQHATTPVARAAYLKGQDAMAEHTSAGFDRAVNAFQEAIDADPHYAPAFAELANCYTLMAYNYNQPQATIALLTKAKESARRALRLDSTLAEAYGSLADIEALSEFDWHDAEQNYKRAVELNPAYLPAHISYALHLLTPLGRFEEARAQFAYADRVTTRTVRTDASLALATYFARRYDDSIQKALSVKKQFPDFSVIDEILAENYLAKGEPAKVMSLLALSRPVSDDARAVKDIMVGIAFAKLGQRRKAVEQLKHIEASEYPGFSLDYEVAALAAAVGDNGRAIKYLEKSYAYRDTSILFLNVDPLMDPLRSNVHFQRLLTKLNLH